MNFLNTISKKNFLLFAKNFFQISNGLLTNSIKVFFKLFYKFLMNFQT